MVLASVNVWLVSDARVHASAAGHLNEKTIGHPKKLKTPKMKKKTWYVLHTGLYYTDKVPRLSHKTTKQLAANWVQQASLQNNYF